MVSSIAIAASADSRGSPPPAPLPERAKPRITSLSQDGQLGGYATRITDLLPVTKELAATEAAELAAAARLGWLRMPWEASLPEQLLSASY